MILSYWQSKKVRKRRGEGLNMGTEIGIIAFLIVTVLFVIVISSIWRLVLLYGIKSTQQNILSKVETLFREIRNLKAAQPSELKEKTPATVPAEKKSEVLSSVGVPEVSPVKPVKPEYICAKSEQPAAGKVEAPVKPKHEVDWNAYSRLAEEKAAAKISSPRKASEFETKVNEILKKIWNWIVVGEEFRNKNVSMEYAVASVWLLRAGIIIILAFVVSGLKYSIENNLVGPLGRISLGIFWGLVMLIGGFRLAGKKYHIIAQGLLGGGIATLYLSVFASFALYKFTDFTTSFALMILITFAAGVISVRLNSLLVAILGVIGGYCTPIMLNTGASNFPGLFGYMLLLGIGVIGVSKYKDWKLLNFLSFIFTYAIFFAALERHYDETVHFEIVITFLSLFFLQFSFLSLFHNILHGEKSNLLSLGGMVANAAVFFSTGHWLILNKGFEKQYVAILTVSLAVFYTLQAWAFIEKKTKDRNLLVILIGFASFFVTYTIPLIFSDEWITTAWSIQALIFLWMSCRLNSNFLRTAAYLMYVLAIGRLFIFDFHKSFVDVKTVNYLNEMLTRFMTFGLLIVSFAIGSRFLKKHSESKKIEGGVIPVENDIADMAPLRPSYLLFISAALLFLFVYLHFEFHYLSRAFYPPIEMTLISFVWMAAIACLFVQYRKTQRKALFNILVAVTVGFMVKLLFFDLPFWDFSVGRMLFSTNCYYERAGMRALDFLPTIALFAVLMTFLNRRKISPNDQSSRFFGIITLGFAFIYLTLEVNTFFSWQAPNFKAGAVSILWGLMALSAIISGIVKGIKPLRYAGLLLFLIVALKIFFLDLERLSQLYRIIAFLVLGMVFLAGAVIYVRFGKMFAIASGKEK